MTISLYHLEGGKIVAGKGKKKSGSKQRKAKANGSEESQMGHNIRITKKVAADYARRFNHIQDEREDEAEKYKDDTDALIEEMSDALGVSRAVARQSMREQRVELKREKREAAMDPERLRDLDKLRDALGLFADTPLAAAAIKAEEKKPEAGASSGD